jgi:hypothetical protein
MVAPGAGARSAPVLHLTVGAHEREQVSFGVAHGTAPFSAKTLPSIGPSAIHNCGLKKHARIKAHTRPLVVPSNSAINHFISVIPRPAFFGNFDLRQRTVERT